jgi:hypothetical protein
MSTDIIERGSKRIINRQDFGALIEALHTRSFRVIGPVHSRGAVILDEIESPDDLPIGWTDEQDAGHYRLLRTNSPRLFGYVVGPHSLRNYLHTPKDWLWQTNRGDTRPDNKAPACEKTAFLGIRSCGLAALAVHDKIMQQGPYPDPHYRARREGIVIVAVNCTQPGGTCFCDSMNTGPRATEGFDLALTEMLEEDRHYFLCEVGSAQGAELLGDVPTQPTGAAEIASVDREMEAARGKMGRSMDTTNIKEMLYDRFDSTYWEEVAARCFNCGNCTLVCPTCFCSTIEDSSDLDGIRAERRRLWDSCFSLDHSYIHGGSVRTSAVARYRQWLIHKLAYWIDQFGTSGCTGCGRCITWCPAAIDITAEAQALREK